MYFDASIAAVCEFNSPGYAGACTSCVACAAADCGQGTSSVPVPVNAGCDSLCVSSFGFSCTGLNCYCAAEKFVDV